jgi:hypothetical protein
VELLLHEYKTILFCEYSRVNKDGGMHMHASSFGKFPLAILNFPWLGHKYILKISEHIPKCLLPISVW